VVVTVAVVIRQPSPKAWAWMMTASVTTDDSFVADGESVTVIVRFETTEIVDVGGVTVTVWFDTTETVDVGSGRRAEPRIWSYSTRVVNMRTRVRATRAQRMGFRGVKVLNQRIPLIGLP
jgi:hypothetical protein